MGKIIGYARVSTKEQNLARQIESLEKFGCEKIYTDKLSGKDFTRDAYLEMKEFVREEDIVVVHELSRFGRNKERIMEEWTYFVDKGVDIVVLDAPILDTRKYKELKGFERLITDLFLAIMSQLVEEERTRAREAQRQGIKIAKRNGVYKGKETKYTFDHKGVLQAYKLHKEGTLTMKEITETVGISRSTLYRRFKELESKES